MKNYNNQYGDLIKKIMLTGSNDYNMRTDSFVKALPGQSIQVDLHHGFPLLGLRRIPVRTFVAETLWMLTGEQSLTKLKVHCGIWDDFAGEDNMLETSYGYRLRYHFARDQIKGLVDLMGAEGDSRHGVITPWSADEDGLGKMGVPRANIPCWTSFQTFVSSGRIHGHVVFRSNDMILGHPTDFASFALFLMIIAQASGRMPGTLTIAIGNCHLYRNHLATAYELIDRAREHELPVVKLTSNMLPDYIYDRVTQTGEIDLIVNELVDKINQTYVHMGPATNKPEVIL